MEQPLRRNVVKPGRTLTSAERSTQTARSGKSDHLHNPSTVLFRYSREEVYRRAQVQGQNIRGFGGMVYTAKRMGLLWQSENK